MAETSRHPLARLTAAAAAVVVLGAACSSSVAGLYSSGDGKLLELSEDGRWAMDFGHAAAELSGGPEVLTGRYEITDGTVRLRYVGKVVIELRRDGDHLVMRDGTVFFPTDEHVPHALHP